MYPFASAVASARHWFREDIEAPAIEFLGGPARFKVIVLLACVLGLDAADKATIGAIAVRLQAALNIGNVQLGLLVTATTAVGALATLPLGILTDRIRRVRLLTIAIVVWSIAMAVSGFATSYLMLLLTRLALGAVVATAAPAIASLTGDFFRATERGRIFGYIVTGELLGAAFGFVVSAMIADFLNWRMPFWVLSVIGLVLAGALHWLLPEPARGGQSRIAPGDTEILTAEEASDEEVEAPQDDEGGSEDLVEEEIEEAGFGPRPARVLENDPKGMSWPRAFGYILSIRTNILIIVATALAYFYLTGLRTFGVVFMHARFDLSQTAASAILVASGLGAIAGVLLIGRAADREIEHGNFRARLWVPAIAFGAAIAFLLPGLLVPILYATAILFFLGAFFFGGVIPPMNAARLDIMHSRLWGRGESVNSALRYAFEAIAPITFGYISTFFGVGGNVLAQAAHGQAGGDAGLGTTLALMLVTLLGAGIALLFALRHYPRDVVTANASEERTSAGSRQPH
ncbi:MAG: MFS transporter [Gammaproteobacteria bacterium]|nr:MFS transporter [Gammaproteobacteria bacterium]